MLFWLSQLGLDHFPFLRIVHYISFRSIVAALTALIISLILGPVLIKQLTAMQIGQVVRDDGPQSHLKKTGTPTMGGVLMLVAMTVSLLLWGDLHSPFLWLALLGTLGFGVVGWVDDYRKLIKKNPKGISAREKLFSQGGITLLIVLLLYFLWDIPAATQLFIPYTKEFYFSLGVLMPLFCFFVIVGSSNAVNLTDGLDGLAIVPIIMVGSALGIFAYLSGNVTYAHYLELPYLPGVGEMAVFASALAGAGLGFLWFNSYPAQIFMGDVGALALGGALGILAVLVRQELVLFIMGGIFVAETVSVIMQVGYFKMTKKRIFKMAPLHHHFELMGWPEPKVIVRFWIITVILVLIGLASLKIR